MKIEATVKIKRAEGPSSLCGKWKEFKSIKEANKELSYASNTYPKMGYDKHDFLITFSDPDQSTYDGRLDCQHIENKYYSMQSNNIYESATSFLKWIINSETEAKESKEEAKKYLEMFNAAME